MGRKYKIVSCYLFFVALFILFGIVAYAQLSKVSSLLETIYYHPMPVTRYSLLAEINVVKIHRDMKDVVLQTNVKKLSSLFANIEEEERLASASLRIVQQRILGDKGKHLVNQAVILLNEWRPIRKKVIDLVVAGKSAEAALVTQTIGAKHVRRLQDKMQAIMGYAANKSNEFYQSSGRDVFLAKLTIISFVVILSVLYFMFLMFLIRHTSILGTVRKRGVLSDK